MQKPDIHRLLEFQKLILQFRNIERKLHLPTDLTKFENDSEHSYSLAMTCWYISHYFPHLDKDLVIRYALAHDLVEIHAGDTFPYGDKKLVDSKKEREHLAFQKLAKDWADFPDMIEAIESYEKRESEEAKFVYAMDKILPTMLNFLGNGHGWREHKLSIDDVRTEKATKAAVSPEVNHYYNQLMELLEQNLDLFPAADTIPER